MMRRRIFKFDDPERCIIGTIGTYPDQSYFLQVTDQGKDVAVQMDDRQVRLLGKRIDQLLDTVTVQTNLPVAKRVRTPKDMAPLHMPVDSEFLVGSIGLAWDVETLTLMIEVMDFTDLPITPEMMMQDSKEGPDSLRITLCARDAREFACRAKNVYTAGRPVCPLCDQPLDDDSHLCVRLNGYRRDLSGSLDNLIDYLA